MNQKPAGAPGRHGGTDLTTGSIPRHLIKFSIPMLMGNLFQAGYNIVNSIWVGNFLGTAALGAIALSFPIFFLLMALAAGLSMAASVLVSQAYGARELDKMARVIQNSILLTVLMAIFCLAAGYLTIDDLLVLMQTPPEIAPLALRYMHIFIWSIPPMFGLFLISSILRGVGDSKTPMKFQLGALIMATILDPLLMFGWMGFPRMGLDGTAIALVAAQTTGMVALLVYLKWKRHMILPSWRGFRPDFSIILLTLKIGVPGIIQNALVSVGMVVLFKLVNVFGKDAIAAFGAAMRIDQFAFLPAMTVGTAVSNLVGQNLGAGLHDRVRQTFWYAILMTCGITVPVSLFAVLDPELILRLFTQDPAVLAIGSHYLHLIGPGYLLFAVMFVSNGVINGSGHTFFTTLISLIALWLVRLPLAAWLSKTSLGIDGIWIGMLSGFGTGMVLSLGYFLSGRWKNVVGIPGPIPEIETTPAEV